MRAHGAVLRGSRHHCGRRTNEREARTRQRPSVADLAIRERFSEFLDRSPRQLPPAQRQHLQLGGVRQLLEARVAPDKLPAFLASQNLSLSELGPVGADSIPPALGGNSASQVAEEALRLAADRPYSNPLPVPAGAAILVWRENIASRTPALAEVREKVLADYQAAEKRRLFNEAGRKLRETVSTDLAAGIYVFQQTGSAFLVGVTLMATAVPSLIVGLVAGVFVDRHDLRRIMMLSNLAQGVIVFLIPFVLGIDITLL